MGKCKYCGLSAGLFSSAHKECREKHEKGMATLLATLSGFFNGSNNMSYVQREISSVQALNFLSTDEVEQCCRQALKAFAASVHLPITKQHLQVVDEFLNNIGISRSVLNQGGELDAVAARFYQGVLTSYFAEGEPIAKVQRRAQMVEGLLPVEATIKERTGLNVMERAAKNFLSRGLISDSEQARLDDFSHALQLPVSNFAQNNQNSYIVKAQQAAILRQLQRGQTPAPQYASVPIMLSSGEFVVWEYTGVTMYQEKITREWVGRRSGWSYRVMKGVYYHTGGSKGTPVERSSMENLGTGSLVLTNKNIIFFSPQRSAKVPYKKLIGVTPYSDGVELQKEEAHPLRQVFQGFDSWFLINFLSYVSV